MKPFFFLFTFGVLLLGCAKPPGSVAQPPNSVAKPPPTMPEYSSAFKEALKEVVFTFDSTEIHQRAGISFSVRAVTYGGFTLSEEDKQEQIMDGHSIIYVTKKGKDPNTLDRSHYLTAYYVAGRPEGTWEYFTPVGKLFKRETYQDGVRKKVEYIP